MTGPPGCATVAEVVGLALVEGGVRQAFGLVGSGNFHLSNALVSSGAVFTTARHETGAVIMADAYAKVSGHVGVVTLHQGCGLTNAITGIAEATKSGSPMLVLSADTAAAEVHANFRIDQDALVRSVGAVSERVHGPSSVHEDVRRAWHQAVSCRRTVVVNLATDVQAMPAERLLACLPSRALPPRPASEAIREVAELLANAKRSVLLAGRGARGHCRVLEQLADRTGALLATTAVARGLFRGNAWSVGVCGGLASPTAARLIASADVVVAFGAGLNGWTTRHGALIEHSVLVQVDDDVTALGLRQPVAIGLLGDVGETAAALVGEFDSVDAGGSGWRSPELADEVAAGAWSRERIDDVSTQTRIDPRAFSRALDEILPLERTVAVDSGHFLGWPSRYLSVPDEHGSVFSQAFQGVGLGLASAIGAAIARPDRLTIAAMGDGGLLMGLADLETVARLGLPMAVVVYNDSAYGAEAHHFADQPLDLVQFPETDFAALGRAVGLRAVTVRRLQDLEQVSSWVAEGCSPAIVIDVKVVASLVADWLEEAFSRH